MEVEVSSNSMNENNNMQIKVSSNSMDKSNKQGKQKVPIKSEVSRMLDRQTYTLIKIREIINLKHARPRDEASATTMVTPRIDDN